MSDELLPSDHVPDCYTIGHDAEKDNKDKGEEGRCCPDVEWHYWGGCVFVLPEDEVY